MIVLCKEQTQIYDSFVWKNRPKDAHYRNMPLEVTLTDFHCFTFMFLYTKKKGWWWDHVKTWTSEQITDDWIRECGLGSDSGESGGQQRGDSGFGLHMKNVAGNILNCH